jgi:hypothetical protein
MLACVAGALNPLVCLPAYDRLTWFQRWFTNPFLKVSRECPRQLLAVTSALVGPRPLAAPGTVLVILLLLWQLLSEADSLADGATYRRACPVRWQLPASSKLLGRRLLCALSMSLCFCLFLFLYAVIIDMNIIARPSLFHCSQSECPWPPTPVLCLHRLCLWLRLPADPLASILMSVPIRARTRQSLGFPPHTVFRGASPNTNPPHMVLIMTVPELVGYMKLHICAPQCQACAQCERCLHMTCSHIGHAASCSIDLGNATQPRTYVVTVPNAKHICDPTWFRCQPVTSCYLQVCTC